MNVTIYALNYHSSYRGDSVPNLSFHPPDQKTTVYLGSPKDRWQMNDPIRKWVVVVPDSASIEGGMLKWLDGSQQRWLTAEEVYLLAQKADGDFHFAQG